MPFAVFAAMRKPKQQRRRKRQPRDPDPERGARSSDATTNGVVVENDLEFDTDQYVVPLAHCD
jgi:hypothetical protein